MPESQSLKKLVTKPITLFLSIPSSLAIPQKNHRFYYHFNGKRKNRTNVIAEFYGEQRNKISAISPKKIGEIADKISVSLRFFCDDGWGI